MNNMNPLQEIKNEVTVYFEDLGYKTSWDFNKSTGKRWYEIFDGERLVAQIDMGIPLFIIVMDMIAWSRGEQAIEQGFDYELRQGHGCQFDQLLSAVAKKGIPHGNMETAMTDRVYYNFNVRDYVWVRLSEKGWRHFDTVDSEQAALFRKDRTKEGYTVFQMHHLMSLFGSMMQDIDLPLSPDVKIQKEYLKEMGVKFSIAGSEEKNG
ncbi:MAG: hypothetical protein KKD77_22945 [Gammaproteobacteria bacterium]|nr:hypothetical protein [Gammaproteobacteria bacterium]